MGSVIPLKKSANNAYLDLRNHLSDKLDSVEKLIKNKKIINWNLKLLKILVIFFTKAKIDIRTTKASNKLSWRPVIEKISAIFKNKIILILVLSKKLKLFINLNFFISVNENVKIPAIKAIWNIILIISII